MAKMGRVCQFGNTLQCRSANSHHPGVGVPFQWQSNM
jgi:hypothetical protein